MKFFSSADSNPLWNISIEEVGPVALITRYSNGKHRLQRAQAFCLNGETKRPSYINFKQIEELVRRGYEVQVKEAYTDRDVTSDVLGRILAQKYRENMRELSASDLIGRLRGL